MRKTHILVLVLTLLLVSILVVVQQHMHKKRVNQVGRFPPIMKSYYGGVIKSMGRC